MRVILINPPLCPSIVKSLGPITRSLFYNSAPLGICYIAAVLREDGHEVKIIDAAVEGLSEDALLKRIRNNSPEIVGITTVTVSSQSVYELAKKIRSTFSTVKIIIGGPHISSNPEDLLNHREVDLAVIGEGEVTFKEVVRAINKNQNLNKVEGLAYVNGDQKIYFTPPRSFIADLDILPFPARDLVPVDLYRPQPNDQKKLPKFSMITSRGCPYSCIFCDKNVFKNVYRSFSPSYIVKEMKHLIRDYKARDIAFVDSTFTPSKNRVYGIIEEIKKYNLEVSWTCSVRVDVLDEELLRAMKNAGCWRVRLGIESGNDEVLKFIKKGITKYQVEKVANWAYEIGLEPKGFFMIGHPTETIHTIEETIRFASKLPLKDITVQINTPIRNTFQYQLIGKYGKLAVTDSSQYSFWEPVFVPNGIRYSELSYYYAKFYLKFYLRPIVWYRHIKDINSLTDIVKYIKGLGIIFYFFNLWLKKKL